ncbi:MAG: single-stranded-DNA-specific exonuclease RecJ [Clostridia bacterium]|nr:single-stranded-DNA-specific exonuclease RecJ [Clostridia bacterium]
MIRYKDRADADKNLISEMSASLGVSTRFAQMLVSRGFTDAYSASKFLYPKLSDLHDPYLLGGMQSAVERIKLAKEQGETVVIYGDYDADGISAVTVLYRSLKIFGIDAIPVIPERDNGYGLSAEMIDFVLETYYPDLIITVDCGISAVQEVAELQDLGVDVIVTDHHEIPDEIPDCTVINCKLKGDYPFDGLCGAGVAYKLAKALVGDKANEFIDIVAIATVADSMALVDENRIIVKEGLKKIQSGRCSKAIKALANVGGLKEVSSTAVAFIVAPRVNAAGRMGDANSALKLFLTDDEDEIQILAKQLNEYNVARQAECDLLYRSAKAMLSSKTLDNRVIALYSKDWKAGLMGITAAKLVEEYSKPVVLFAEKDGVLHGSARSVIGVNIFKAFSAVKDLTVDFGGHAQAAGVSILKENFEEFENRLNEYLTDNCKFEDFIQATEVEDLITEKFSLQFAKELTLLEPFGVGNKKPVFAVECSRAYASPLKFGSPHVGFKSDFIELLLFNGTENLHLLNSEIKKTVIFEPSISIFRGSETLKGIVKEIKTVACRDDGVTSAVFSAQIDSLNQNGEYTPINTEQAQALINQAKTQIYGTLFIVNDYETLNKFNGTEYFEKSVLTPDGKGNISVITLGTSGIIPDGYEKIVYLDKPLSVLKTDKKVFVNQEIDGFSKVGISTDRLVLGKVFVAVKNRPLGFISVTELVEETGLSARQITFAVKVFIELGLIIPQGGRYKAVGGIKRELTDSSVYKSIKRILG